MRKTFAKYGLVLASSLMLAACSSSSSVGGEVSGIETTSTGSDDTTTQAANENTQPEDVKTTEAANENTQPEDVKTTEAEETTTEEVNDNIYYSIENAKFRYEMYDMEKDCVCKARYTNLSDEAIYLLGRAGENNSVLLEAGEVYERDFVGLYIMGEGESWNEYNYHNNISAYSADEFSIEIANMNFMLDIDTNTTELKGDLIYKNTPSNKDTIYEVENDVAKLEVYSCDPEYKEDGSVDHYYISSKFSNISPYTVYMMYGGDNYAIAPGQVVECVDYFYPDVDEDYQHELSYSFKNLAGSFASTIGLAYECDEAGKLSVTEVLSNMGDLDVAASEEPATEGGLDEIRIYEYDDVVAYENEYLKLYITKITVNTSLYVYGYAVSKVDGICISTGRQGYIEEGVQICHAGDIAHIGEADDLLPNSEKEDGSRWKDGDTFEIPLLVYTPQSIDYMQVGGDRLFDSSVTLVLSEESPAMK